MSCTRAQEFLAQEKVVVAEQVDAKKERLGPDEALALAREASELFVAKGQRVLHVDMQRRPPDEELLKVLLGPSGNLRAPTIRAGSTLLVGFDPDVYARVLVGAAANERAAPKAAKPRAAKKPSKTPSR